MCGRVELPVPEEVFRALGGEEVPVRHSEPLTDGLAHRGGVLRGGQRFCALDSQCLPHRVACLGLKKKCTAGHRLCGSGDGPLWPLGGATISGGRVEMKHQHRQIKTVRLILGMKVPFQRIISGAWIDNRSAQMRSGLLKVLEDPTVGIAY